MARAVLTIPQHAVVNFAKTRVPPFFEAEELACHPMPSCPQHVDLSCKECQFRSETLPPTKQEALQRMESSVFKREDGRWQLSYPFNTKAQAQRNNVEQAKDGDLANFNYTNEKNNGNIAYGHHKPNGKAAPEKKKGPVKKAYKRTKSVVQHNKYTQPFCPPTGEVATTLTLILTIVTIFLAARTVLGPIVDIGGTIFALLMLILVALIGGKLVLGFSWILLRFCKVDIRLPPLLGMLIVGIILKNVPYNFGQFGRAECSVDHKNASFIDSIHDLDGEEDKGSFRKRRDVFFDEEIEAEQEFLLDRVARSLDSHDDHHKTEEVEEDEEGNVRSILIGHRNRRKRRSDEAGSPLETVRTAVQKLVVIQAADETWNGELLQ